MLKIKKMLADGAENISILEVKNTCAGYEGREVLHHINLEIERGKITVLVGPNGCGKSTLLKVMTGMHSKFSGEITVEGRQIESYKSNELAQKIAYLPQNRNVPEISVQRMVLHGRFPYLQYPRRYRKIDLAIAKKALEQVGMEEYAEKNMKQLSGGMQQKVYIAMALAQDTPVIMMDEPTSFLDIVYQLKLMEMARELAVQGKAVVMVLHDIAMALRTADKMVVLSEGEVQGVGTPSEVFEKGILDEVFGLKIKRIETEDGWQYYYQDKFCHKKKSLLDYSNSDF